MLPKHEESEPVSAQVVTHPAMSANPTPPESASAPKTGGKGKRSKDDKPIDWGRFNRLLENFVLIYGTDTVWDGELRMLVKVNALRLAFGHDYVKMWLNSEQRRMINPDQLQFEPGKDLEHPCINLFDGLAIEPKEGDCEPILELLHYLCSACDDDYISVAAWVLKWMAYPFQHLGAKMQTALVFHGPQGAGKNLLFEILTTIYGRYGIVLGQAQLEDKFNDCFSQKLMVIGDEVVSRAELYHHKNMLKALITGETIQINAKMMPLRTERNHMNAVFMSNENVPVKGGAKGSQMAE